MCRFTEFILEKQLIINNGLILTMHIEIGMFSNVLWVTKISMKTLLSII